MSASRSGRASKPYGRPARTQGRAPEGLWVHDKAPIAPAALLNVNNKPASAANTKLLVSNLHYEISPKDLTSIFGQIGTLVREPLIRYDRSGRSSGIAIISFETSAEATRAKNQFDGILAKGQPMNIVFDTVGPPQHPRSRRAVSASSLLNRIEKAPLVDRVSRDDIAVKAPTGPRGGVGPIRTRARGGARPPRPAPKKPKTAEDLDKELDAFMDDGEDKTAPQEPAPVMEGDVDMT